MANCKFLFCTLIIGLFSHVSIAQQVYRSQHYGGPGTQYLYSSHNTGIQGEELLIGGENQQWNVSALQATDLDLSEIVTRDEGIDAFTFTALCTFSGINVFTCLNIWTNTQQAWLQLGSQDLLQLPVNNLQRYQRKTPTQLLETFFGFSVDLGGSATPVVVVYPGADTIHAFPITYNDSLTSHVAWAIDLAPTGQNIQYSSRQTRTSKVDGWGTLITPYDTLFDVLRVRAVIARNDTLTTDSLSVPINISQVEYTWYDSTYGLPIMIANGILTDTAEVIASLSYLVEAECSTPELMVTSDAPIYYIDGTGNAFVEFSTNNSNTNTYNWDFGDGTLESSTGDITHLYSIPGVYEIAVTGCMTNCLPLNTCATQTLTIEVVDTTSAVRLLTADELGIRVFPNPARDVMTILIPGNKSNFNYSLIDVYGHVAHVGSMRSELSTISLSKIPAGIYTLQLQRALKTQYYQGIRVVVAR